MKKTMFLIYLPLLFLGACAFNPDQQNTEAVLTGNHSWHNATAVQEHQWYGVVPEEARSIIHQRFLHPADLDITGHFHLQIKNAGMSDLFYLHTAGNIEWIEIYWQTARDAPWQAMVAGDQIPTAYRIYPMPVVAFPMHLEKDTNTDVYIRVKDYQHTFPQFRVLGKAAYHHFLVRQFGLQFFILSLLLITGIYYLVLFSAARDSAHFFYAVSLFATLFYLGGKYRLVPALLFPYQAYGFFIYIFSASASALFFILFLKTMLSVKNNTAPGRIMLAIATAFGFIAGFSFFHATVQLGNIMNAIMVPGIIFIMVLLLFRKHSDGRTSRIVLYSFIPLTVGVVIENMAIFLRLPQSQLTLLGIAMGASAHVVIMNYAMLLRQANRNRAYAILRQDFVKKVEDQVKLRTRELETTARRDPLTGLFNRASLNEQIELLEKGPVCDLPMGILFVDIDNFKHYNDRMGHRIGDEVIKKTAQFLQVNTRQSDSVYRYGGDEFLILMPGTDAVLLKMLSTRLVESYHLLPSSQDAIARTDFTPSISIGGYCWSGDISVSIREAIHLADKTLLEAKNTGKNRSLVHAR